MIISCFTAFNQRPTVHVHGKHALPDIDMLYKTSPFPKVDGCCQTFQQPVESDGNFFAGIAESSWPKLKRLASSFSLVVSPSSPTIPSIQTIIISSPHSLILITVDVFCIFILLAPCSVASVTHSRAWCCTPLKLGILAIGIHSTNVSAVPNSVWVLRVFGLVLCCSRQVA